MNDFDKMTLSINKLQDNSEYTVDFSDVVDEELFNSISWISTNTLTWLQVKEEMDKL